MKQLFFNARKGLISLACLIAFSVTGMANIDEPTEALRKEIIELIDNPDLTDTGIEEVSAMLHFTVNKHNELVVLVVETDSRFVEDYLKNKLNYQKMKVDLPRRDEYRLKVTFKSREV